MNVNVCKCWTCEGIMNVEHSLCRTCGQIWCNDKGWNIKETYGKSPISDHFYCPPCHEKIWEKLYPRQYKKSKK